MDNINRLLDELIDREGGYSNHPSDAGGATRWGVTEAVARANGYGGNMRDYPREEAARVYLKRYWFGPGFNRVAQYSLSVAEELFDTGVNMGPAIAATFLQEALNALNGRGKLYPDIPVDGEIGPATIAALRQYRERRGKDGEQVLVIALNVLQGARYFRITPPQHRHEDFLYGWLRTRIGALA